MTQCIKVYAVEVLEVMWADTFVVDSVSSRGNVSLRLDSVCSRSYHCEPRDHGGWRSVLWIWLICVPFGFLKDVPSATFTRPLQDFAVDLDGFDEATDHAFVLA